MAGSSCRLHNKGDTLVLDVFIHVTILLIVLYVLFRYIISPLETREMSSQLKDAINENMPQLYKQIDEDGALTTVVKGMKSSKTIDAMQKMYSEPDVETAEWNDALFRESLMVIIAVFLGFLGIWAVMTFSCGKCPPVGRLITENVILFTLVGVVEGLFFYLIAMHYSPVMPSYMSKTVLNSLEKNLAIAK